MDEETMQAARETLRKIVAEHWPQAESVEIVDGAVLLSLPDYDLALEIEPV